MNYRWMNRGDRIEVPLVKRGGELHATDWEDAFERVTTVLRGAGPRVVALMSPRASLETLFFARELFRGSEWTGAFQVVMGEEAPLAGVPDLALRAERTPNGRVQRYAQAKPAPGMARPGWWVFSELGAALGRGEPVGSAAEAFERAAQAIEPLRGLSYQQLGFAGKRAAVAVPA